MTDHLHKIFLTTLWSPDTEATASFYRQSIGLTPLSHAAEHPHFQLGEAILAIQPGNPRPAENTHAADFPLLAITVPDLDQAVARLEQHGAKLPFGIEGGPSQRWVKLFDPAGNLIELVEQVQTGDQLITPAPFYTDYLQKTAQLIDQYKQALSNLSVQALDWKPAPQANSLAVLAMHTAGAYRYWLLDVISGVPSGRDREAEFLNAGLESAAIFQELDKTLELLSTVLSRLELQDLNSTRFSSRDQKIYTVGRSLLHVYEHTALHLGHMQVTRQVWEARRDDT